MTLPTASDNPFPSLLITEGSAPASPAAGKRRLYVLSSDHLAYLKDSAGVVVNLISNPMTTKGDLIVGDTSGVPIRKGVGSDGQVLTADSASTGGVKWAAGGGGSAQEHNEIAAAALVNATSTGDAGNRSDHFTGAALSGNWTQEASALSSGPTVKYSMFGGVRTSGVTHYRQAYTPSGAFRVEARCWMHAGTNQGGIGLLIRDSGSGDTSGEAMLALHRWISGDNSQIGLFSLDSGTYTLRQNTSVDSFGDANGNAVWPIYIYIERNGSNVWTAGFSLDRVTWVSTATHSKTFTVAKLALRMDSINAFGWDFVDVVS